MNAVDQEHLTPRERELLELGRRSELLEEIKVVVRQEMQDQFRQHFGDRKPEEVLEVMRSAERLHRRLDKVTESFWGTALAFCFKWGLVAFLVTQLAQHSGTLQKLIPGGQ